jgi:uncharacterized protein
MKFVLLLIAVFALLWMLRGGLRRRMRPPDVRPAAPKDAAQAMLTCAHCGVHLPRDEALPGRGGVFCDAAHRVAYETAHPDS